MHEIQTNEELFNQMVGKTPRHIHKEVPQVNQEDVLVQKYFQSKPPIKKKREVNQEKASEPETNIQYSHSQTENIKKNAMLNSMELYLKAAEKVTDMYEEDAAEDEILSEKGKEQLHHEEHSVLKNPRTPNAAKESGTPDDHLPNCELQEPTQALVRGALKEMINSNQYWWRPIKKPTP